MILSATFLPHRPVVLLHAFPLHRRMWDPQVAALAQAGFSPLAVDLPGFGGTPPGGERSLADFAARVLATLDALHVEKAAFVGLSMGGYVLFRILEMAPERVQAAVLADTRAQADTPEARARRLDQAAQVAARGPQAIVEGFVQSALSPATHANRPEVVERVRHMVLGASITGIVTALWAMADRPDSTALLGSVRVPALVLVGEQDALTPPEVAQAMAARLPRGRLVTLPQAGHLANLEQPEAFNRALVEFLREL